MPTRYLEQTKKMNLSKIDLKVIRKFYLIYICPYNYKLELDDGVIINLKFEENQLPHLLGLHKLRINNGKIASEIIESIKLGNLNLIDVKKTDNTNLNFIKDRLCFFPTLKTILDKPDVFIKFNPFVCMPTQLECNFLLQSTEIKVTVYLGIRKKEEGKKEIECFPITFLVDRVNQYNKEKQSTSEILKFSKSLK